MTKIVLKPSLLEQIEHLIKKEETTAEAFVEKAIRTYIAQLHREKIRAESDAFHTQFDKLLAKYEGQYVAIHNGQVIDHGPDLRTLHLRVFERLGHTPVLLKQVMTDPEQELVFRSPRFERSHS
jgi:hypothetical protein